MQSDHLLLLEGSFVLNVQPSLFISWPRYPINHPTGRGKTQKVRIKLKTSARFVEVTRNASPKTDWMWFYADDS